MRVRTVMYNDEYDHANLQTGETRSLERKPSKHLKKRRISSRSGAGFSDPSCGEAWVSKKISNRLDRIHLRKELRASFPEKAQFLRENSSAK
ncbi:hypothetical protein VNO77_03442 [Canavalia gladiata]|uniref:Uncharacterized protein n=1 Tax=Canavalia gladiata TaxID=3824 RepID=A0AAN9R6V5_CANGL